MAIFFEIQRTGNDFYAEPNGGSRFFVGRSVHFTSGGLTRVGLYNVPLSATPKVYYNASQFPALGFWAEFLAPTAMCEGRGNFVTLNTYDRAAFTWGFGQFGAHVPNGDFVRWFRGMLARPEKNDYFPDLLVEEGHVTRRSTGTITPLETSKTTQPLMDYLNPSPTGVDDDEVIAAAKLIHWTVEHAGAREAQVTEMKNTARRILVEADGRLGLDRRSADQCCVVFDIRHQGRGAYKDMQAALATNAPLKALLEIGAHQYPERIKTLRAEIKTREQSFGAKTWSRAKGDFV